MSLYEKTEIILTCPICKKQFKTLGRDICDSRKVKCGNYSCGVEINFDSSAASNLKYAFHDLEKANEKVAKLKNDVMDKITVVPKK